MSECCKPTVTISIEEYDKLREAKDRMDKAKTTVYIDQHSNFFLGEKGAWISSLDSEMDIDKFMHSAAEASRRAAERTRHKEQSAARDLRDAKARNKQSHELAEKLNDREKALNKLETRLEQKLLNTNWFKRLFL